MSEVKPGKLMAIYGPPGSGKSLCAVRSLPSAVAYCEVGAQPEWLGFTNRRVGQFACVQEMTATFKKVAQSKSAKPGSAIVVEDVNYVFKRTVELSEESGWDRYDELEKLVMGVEGALDWAKKCNERGVHVLMTAHEQQPRTANSGKKLLGTCEVPGWQLPNSMPGRFDLFGHMEYSTSYRGWHWWIRLANDDGWIVKNRLNIDAPDVIPPNIGALLHEGGYDIMVPEELAWMEAYREPMVKKLHEILAEDYEANVTDELRTFAEHIVKKEPSVNKRHVRWLLTDALDTALLRATQSNTLESFFDSLD